MLLYKYLTFDAAARVLDNNSIGFSQPQYFNDPFDMPSYPDEGFGNSIEQMLSHVQIMGKNMIWAENTGILSLTRTPTNPLMWAHYAQNHYGVVIGIDAIKAGLADEQSNLIPAQYGSVIYVSRRSPSPFVTQPQAGLQVGGTHHFPNAHYEKLQRLFLHKPICWAYEEEVRVVKCIRDVSPATPTTPSGTFDVVFVHDRPMYLFKLPPNSIKEIYFGFRSADNLSDELYKRAIDAHDGLKVRQCNLNAGELTVGHEDYTPLSEIYSI